MKKRRFLTVFVTVACLLSVIGGHFYYNNKLEETAYAAKQELAMTQKDPAEKTASKETQKPSENSFKNAPRGVAELYKQRKDAGIPLIFHLVGSTNTSTEEGTWSNFSLPR